ncbi:MAG TPA: NusG domain II-containing protein [Solimonas sp.]|nr:NusG domain II-containing protein [Solimonas sp.]
MIRPTLTDVVVVIAAALLVGALAARYWTPARPAQAVEVRAGAQLVGRYDLAQDRDVSVQGPRGTSHLRIEAGRVRFLDSPCRNRVCVHSGWLSHAGEVAACLPNRVSVRLLGGEKDALDGVSM